MEIEIINTVDQFSSIRSDWENAYKQDEEATIHRSWAWIRGWLESTQYDWFVLAAREKSDSPYIAFFPLCFRKSKSGVTELLMGGHPLSAHTGIVSIPEYDSTVIKAFAHYIDKQLEWETFLVRDVLDPRFEAFIEHIRSGTIHIDTNEPTACPYVVLPDDWDEYMKTALNSKARNYLRKAFKQLEQLENFKIIPACDSNLEQVIERFLALWQSRWGEKSESELDEFRFLFRFGHKHDMLRLVEYCDGEERFAFVAAWVDKAKNSLYGFAKCYNPEFAGIDSPGKTADLIELKMAMENGYKIFDLGRGNEKYKYQFGAVDRFNANYTITRKSRLKSIYKNLKKLSGNE